jgi:hypothetical protein
MFLWLRNDYNPKIEGGLCRVCRQLAFKYLLKVASPNEIHLGTFKEIKIRDCAFCRLFMEDTLYCALYCFVVAEEIRHLWCLCHVILEVLGLGEGGAPTPYTLYIGALAH